MDKSILNLVAIVLFIVLPTGVVVSTWMHGRPMLKKHVIKSAVSTVLMCLMLVCSIMQYRFYAPADSQEELSPDELELQTIALMNEKFDSVSEYTFYDHAEDVMYYVPNPYPECPFVLKGIDAENKLFEKTIESYDELPVLLDTVWYWYGTQGATEEYSMLTFGDVLSLKNIEGQSQVFVAFDKDMKLANIYTAELPIKDKGEISMQTMWTLPMVTLCVALVWITVRNVVFVAMRRKEVKEARTRARKGGLR